MAERSIAELNFAISPARLAGRAPLLLAGVAFAVLFAEPAWLLARDWWNDPEAGHGLLLAPVSIWLVWRAGVRADAAPNRVLGIALLISAILLRYLSGLAAEMFTMRFSMVLGLAGLTTYYLGLRQLLSWWLPFTLFTLAIPLPEVIKSAMTLPLQFRASRMGAASSLTVRTLKGLTRSARVLRCNLIGMLRSVIVSGIVPMPASTFAQKTLKLTRCIEVPTQRGTLAPLR